MYPKSTADELRAYIYRSAPPGQQILFTRPQISEAETRIRLVTKRGSTTAFQFYEQRNIVRRHLFWTRPYPLGVVGTARADLVDLDEWKISLNTCDRKSGKAFYSGVH